MKGCIPTLKCIEYYIANRLGDSLMKHFNTKLLASILVVAVIASMFSLIPAAAQAPGYAKRIVLMPYTDDTKGLAALKKGEIDIYYTYTKPITVEDLKAVGLSPEEVTIAKASGGIAVMLLNILRDKDELGQLGIITDPDGKKHFNPLAIREIRFAINLLINRKYIAEKIVGMAYPAYVALTPELPYYDEAVESVVKELGFKPEGNFEKAKEIVETTMKEIAQKLSKYGYKLYKGKDGYWYFQAPGQKPERVSIHIATWAGYTYHEGAMMYLAEQLKKLGFYADVKAGNARSIRDSKDWRYMHWHIYTYRRVISEDMLSIWYIDGLYWTYSSAAIPPRLLEVLSPEEKKLQEQIDKDILALKMAKTISELIERVKKVVKEVLEQSIVIAYVNPLRTVVVSKHVHNAIIGWASNIYNPWLYRLAYVEGRDELRIGIRSTEMNILTEVNPRLAMHTLARTRILMPVVDLGMFPNPYSGTLAPLRVYWKVETLGVGKLPGDALYYDPAKHKWITVSEAFSLGLLNKTKISREKIVAIEYTYVLGKWHHGRDMKLYDILFWLTWNLEWWYKRGSNDKWAFSDLREHPLYPARDSVLCLYGIKIVGENKLIAYTSIECVGTANPDLIAELFIGMISTWGPRSLWPWFPPELMMATGYLLINGGPVTGKAYSLRRPSTEKMLRLDLLNKDCVKDLIAALEKIAAGEYIPPYVEAVNELAKKYPVVGAVDLREGAKALIDFAKKYGNLVVSHGAYYIVIAKADKIVFERFSEYPRSVTALLMMLKGYKLVPKEVLVPPTLVAGKEFVVTLKLYVVPTIGAGKEEPAKEAYIVARIVKEGKVYAVGKVEKVSDGVWKIVFSAEDTRKLKPGVYKLEIFYAISKEAPPGVISKIVRIVSPTPTTTTPPTTPTATATITTTTTTATTTTPTTPTTTTTAAAGISPAVIAGIIVVIVVIAVAAILLRRK